MQQAYWCRSIILGLGLRRTSRKGEKGKEERKKENDRHIVLDTWDGQL